MYRIIVITFLFLMCLPAAYAQQPQQVTSAVHNQHTIKSQVLGEDRTILVRVPQNYQRSDTKYPVIYMLDAHPPQNAMMVGMIEQQVWGDVMPDVVLVGIQNTNRFRDMTPTPGDRPGAGGAEKFLRFIESEVIPFVDKNYRTEPYRTIAGHSLAGLFVVYTFVERPDAFNSYVAAAPNIHWDNNYLIKRAEESFRKRTDWNKRLFIALGNEPGYMDGYNAFQELLTRTKPKSLEYEFRQFKDENHGSVVLPAYYAGIRNTYKGWTAPQAGTVADVEGHYRTLSARYGYAIKIPEALLNQMGYRLIRDGKTPEAIEVFQKNVDNYPKSANVYDSLAEAFEKSGEMSKARENYEKAWKLAEQNGETELAATTKVNFERVSAKK